MTLCPLDPLTLDQLKRLFRHPPLYGALADGELAPFTSIVVRSA